MIEVNRDTIPVHHSPRINLSLLKNEIDLKFIRISQMVNNLPIKNKFIFQTTQYCIKTTEDKGIQTDNQVNETNCTPIQAQSGILTSFIENTANVIKQADFKSEAIQKNIRNSINKVEILERQLDSKLRAINKISASSQLKENVVSDIVPILESNTYTFRQMKQNGRASFPKKTISPYDQTFSSVKHATEFSNVQICKSETDDDHIYKFRTTKQRKDSLRKDSIVSSFIDFSGSEAIRSEGSHPWMWKVQSASICEKRILVSQQCKDKMNEQLNLFILHKRREVDSQIRANILKKIEEKYGEERAV